MKYYLSILIFLIPLFTFSQQKITLMEGKSFEIENYKLDTSIGMFYYKLKLPSGKVKTKSVYQDEVFSVVDDNQEEIILYKPLNEEALNISEMRSFIEGYGTGKMEHQAGWAMLGGFAVGFGSMYASPNAFLSPLIPAAYCGGIALVKPNTDYLIWKNAENGVTPEYVSGYSDAARKKNIKYAIIGSIEGIIVGTLVGSVTGYIR